MYLFDTNIFVEILTNQKKWKTCYQLLLSLEEHQEGWVTSFSLHAIEALANKKGYQSILTGFLSFIDKHPSLKVYETSLYEESEISALTQKISLDFDDTLQYYVAKKKELKLITLDDDFKHIRDIKVLHPENLKGSIL